MVSRPGCKHLLAHTAQQEGPVVCVNKWGLVADKSVTAQKHFEDAIRNKFAPFTDFPILFTLAVTKRRIFKVLETAIEVYNNRKRIIPTSQNLTLTCLSRLP